MKTILFFFILTLFAACSSNISEKPIKIVDEVEIRKIHLEGEVAKRKSEISGLCWYNDHLLILPQYPNSFGTSLGKIFYLEKSKIHDYLSNSETTPLKPSFYTINLVGFEDLFSLGSGFEAATVINDTIYFTIEHLNNGQTESILIFGLIDSQSKSISLNKNSLIKDKSELFIHNISDESILQYKNKILPIYEVFGKNINKNPSISVFSNKLKYERKIKFPNIEYRITDVTYANNDGKFWAINYFYPGDDTKLNPANDQIFEKHGIGKSHFESKPIERLIEMHVNDEEIYLTDSPPIYLKLMKGNSRNWEGLAKLDDLGFLIATDTFPETILAFIPHKSE